MNDTQRLKVQCSKCRRFGEAVFQSRVQPSIRNTNELIFSLYHPPEWHAESVYRGTHYTVRFICATCRSKA